MTREQIEYAYRYLAVYLSSCSIPEEEKKDISQDAICKLCDRDKDYDRTRGAWKTYAARVLRNAALDGIRKYCRRAPDIPLEYAENIPGSKAGYVDDVCAGIGGFVASRVARLLSDGLSPQDVCAALGITRARYRRARKEIKSYLEEIRNG